MTNFINDPNFFIKNHYLNNELTNLLTLYDKVMVLKIYVDGDDELKNMYHNINGRICIYCSIQGQGNA
jgi:hypothetical protein